MFVYFLCFYHSSQDSLFGFSMNTRELMRLSLSLSLKDFLFKTREHPFFHNLLPFISKLLDVGIVSSILSMPRPEHPFQITINIKKFS